MRSLSYALALIAIVALAAGTPGARAQTDPAPTATATATPAPDTPTATAAPTATDTPAASPTPPPPTATAAPATATATPAAPAAPPATARPAPQQSAGLGLEITKTLEGSSLIQVGQYLTFTIRIRNTGALTITTLPVIDEYDPAVLQPALDRFTPPPDTSSSGRLDWADLTALPAFGDMPPGAEYTLTTVFRAVGISDNVINRARIEAAVGSGGQTGAPVGGSAGGAVQGGRVVVEKSLASQIVRADSPAVQFNVTIRNDGAADLTNVPIEDAFDPAYLRFQSSAPPPDTADPAGLLRWNDVLPGLGLTRLRPGQVVTMTTTFIVLQPIDNLVVNRAYAVNVRDEFGNAVQAPRQADVRIRIIGVGAAPTETPADRRRSTATPTPAASATAELTPAAAETATPAAAAQGAAGAGSEGGAGGSGGGAGGSGGGAGGTGGAPARLPVTGGGGDAPLAALAAAALLGIAAAAAIRRQRGRS